jgi:hypothetical protein
MAVTTAAWGTPRLLKLPRWTRFCRWRFKAAADLVYMGRTEWTMRCRRRTRFTRLPLEATPAEFSPESLELLRHYGLVGFNQVAARPGSHTELSIAGEPLLVMGAYGAGKTVAFTGFTPAEDAYSALPDRSIFDC